MITPLVIQQGATWRVRFDLQDSAGAAIDLTGATCRMQARSDYQSTTILFTPTIVNGGVTGQVTVSLTATQTAALSAPSRGVWDLEVLFVDATVIRPVEGTLQVTPEVTR